MPLPKPLRVKKDKRLKIPNFSKFRLLLIVGGVVLVCLIVFMFLAVAVLPKASISIKTDSQTLTSSTVATFKTTPDAVLDVKTGIVPAKSQLVQKTVNQQVPASGQQNNGEKASGEVAMNAGACSGTVPDPVPSGTAITAGGLTFITQETASFGAVISGGKCSFKSGDVTVAAQKAGAAYNIGPSSFAIPGRSGVTTSSSAAMAGGTDNITKIIMQADIDSATQKIGSQDTTAIKEELKTDLTNAGVSPVIETFNTATPETKTSANAGDTADSVTVTQTIKYTMLGVKQDDLKKIIAADVNKKIDTKRQSILDYGLSGIVYGIQSQPADGAVVTMQTQVVAGPELKVEDIKKQVAGKKANDAKELIKQNPGVTEVDVHYSPFWVSSIPKKTAKITVTVEKPKVTKADDSSNANSAP